MTRIIVHDGAAYALRVGRVVPLPRLTNGWRQLYGLDERLVATFSLAPDWPMRAEAEIALAEQTAHATQGGCPGCGIWTGGWRALGYEHFDPAVAPAPRENWAPCPVHRGTQEYLDSGLLRQIERLNARRE